MKELFGKSGGKFIQGLKELGEGRAIKMISSEDIAAADRIEKAFESIKNSWNAIASKPIASMAEFFERILPSATPFRGLYEMSDKRKQVTKYVKDFPEQKDAMNQSMRNFARSSLFGTGKQRDEAHNRFRQIATMRLGSEEEALKYFPLTDNEKSIEADKAAQAAEAETKKNNSSSTENLYVNERAIKIAQEQADLDKVIKHALVAQLDPLDQILAKRQEIQSLVEQSLQEKRKGTTEGDLESIKLQKEAVGIAAGLDSQTTPGIGAIPIDSAAKANLGVGVQAYNPMIYNTQQNTNALKELTQTIKNMQDADPVPRADIATVFE